MNSNDVYVKTIVYVKNFKTSPDFLQSCFWKQKSFLKWAGKVGYKLLKVFVGTCSSWLGAVSTTTGFESIDDVINTVAITMLTTLSLILAMT